MSLGLLLLGVFSVYTMMTAVGRMIPRDVPGTLSLNSYYAYLPLALFLLCLVFLATIGRCARQGAGRPRASWKAPTALLVVGFFSLGAWSGKLTYAANSKVAKRCAGERRLVDQVNAFIREHGGEDRFSIAFDPE